MIRNLSLCILFLFSMNYAFTQVSGYMGKRFLVFYSASLSIPNRINGIFINRNTGGYIQRSKILVAHNHAVRAEYIVSNRFTFGLKYKYAILKTPNALFNDNSLKKISVSSNNYGLYLKFYRLRNLIAPLGYYFQFGLNFQQIHLKDIYKETINNQTYYQEATKLAFVPNFTFGRNLILIDYLLVGLEAEVGLPLPSFPDRSQDLGSRFNTYNELFKISLNLGFIAF